MILTSFIFYYATINDNSGFSYIQNVCYATHIHIVTIPTCHYRQLIVMVVCGLHSISTVAEVILHVKLIYHFHTPKEVICNYYNFNLFDLLFVSLCLCLYDFMIVAILTFMI